MQVTLNIDASNFGDTLGDVFKNLSNEQKYHVAKESFEKWMREPYDVEFNTKKETIVKKLRQSPNDEVRVNDSWSERKKTSECTDAELATTDKFKQLLGEFKTTKQIMVEETTKQIVDYYKTYIVEFVKTDENTQLILKQTIEEVTKQFPAMIHDAIVHWFSLQMNNMGQQIQTALYQSKNAENISKQLAQQITGHNY